MKRRRSSVRLTTAALLVSCGLFLLLGIATILLVAYFLRQHAMEDAEILARTHLDRNMAIHAYFTRELKPAVFRLIAPLQDPDRFDPVWMSSTFAVRRIYAYTQPSAGDPEGIFFKECAVDARSPENEADAWERAFLAELNRRQNLMEETAVRSIDGGLFLVLMRRGEVMEESCLRCHGDPKDAPAELVARYGSEKAFHRRVGMVSSALSVRVPMAAIYSWANRLTHPLSATVMTLFLVLFGIQYAMGKMFFITPLESIRKKAREIAQKAGRGQVGDIPAPFGRELQELTTEINEMIERLDAAYKGQEERIRERTAELSRANDRLRKEISERLNVEAQLRESEERFRLLAESVPDAIVMIDGKNRVLFANPAARAFFNMKEGRLQGTRFGFPLEEGETMEIETPRPDGETAIAEMRVVKTMLNNEPVSIASLRDITERKITESSLKRLAAAIECTAESVHVTDMDATILFVNPAFERITGYSRKEAEGMWAGLLRSPEYPRGDFRSMWESVKAGKVWTGRLPGIRKDGERFEAAATISPVEDSEGRIANAVVVMRDVSQEAALEEQLRQVQKMEAIGTLAGGIAHDFNNILSAILGYTELTLRNLPRESPDRDNLNEVTHAARRARDLVRQILAFSRRTEEEFQPIEYHLIVKEAFKLLRSSLPSDIEMRQDIRRCVPILGDPTQLHQVVMNLCTNASQAMAGQGGVLSLGLEEVDLNAEEAALRNLKGPGVHVKLTVQDTGHGISPAVRDRIFEPYFTTKEKGKGTGLGLSVVHGIVKAHKGSIAVESRPGKGSLFTVLFPASDPEPTNSDPQDTATLQTGNERILVVDDEAILAKMIRQMLERIGYRVESFTDSREALDRFRADPHRFDLVITDMTMPRMTGDHMAREMLSLRPDLPVILCTGFSERIDEVQARSMGIRAFMLKPLVSGRLADTIRLLLNPDACSE